MQTSINRIQLLRGDINSRRSNIHPPYLVGDARFIKQCNRCGLCIKTCPTHIIVSGLARRSLPLPDLSVCAGCSTCIEVCLHYSITISPRINKHTESTPALEEIVNS